MYVLKICLLQECCCFFFEVAREKKITGVELFVDGI